MRQKKQGGAAGVIQREWKHFVKEEDDRKYREKRLTELVQDKERELEESMLPCAIWHMVGATTLCFVLATSTDMCCVGGSSSTGVNFAVSKLRRGAAAIYN